MKKTLGKIFFLVIVFLGSASADYNPQKAVDYAKLHTIDCNSNSGVYRCAQKCNYWAEGRVPRVCSEYWNPAYSKKQDGDHYDSAGNWMGTDCMQFSSQSLVAGGLKKVEVGENGWSAGDLRVWTNWPRIKDYGSNTWAIVRSFKKRLHLGYVKNAKQITNLRDIKVGDLVFLSNSEGAVSHAVIVDEGYNGKYFYYTAHTNDREHQQQKISSKVEAWRFGSDVKTLKLGSNKGSLSSSDGNSKYGHKDTAKADLYKFEVKTSGEYIFHQKSLDEDLDSWLTLLDSNKKKLAFDDDNRERIDVGVHYKRDSVIKRYLSKGTYYLEVSSYRSRDYGDYDLIIQGFSTAVNTIEIGGEIDSKLTSSSSKSKYRSGRYAKTYTLKIEYGDYYTIKLDMSDSMDAYLYVKKIGLSTYYKSDDDGRKHGMGKRDSYIRKYLKSGTYEIEVTTYRSGKKGKFTLSVE